ncbi:MAG TPA: hypothetical protein DDW87_05970 [Firmicutes bacterium]|nr:hypothetical protein [Bacillota bacterium]
MCYDGLNYGRWSVKSLMDIDPPKRWHALKLAFLWRRPQESRKKIKVFLKLGDTYLESGEPQLANYCYSLSKRLAEEAGAIHLKKKIEQRFS